MRVKTSQKECSTSGSCPFSFSDSSFYARDVGCLPEAIDILRMRVVIGKTWACHENFKKPCLGALNRLKELGFEYKVIDNELVTLDNFKNSMLYDAERDKEFYREYQNKKMYSCLNSGEKLKTLLSK